MWGIIQIAVISLMLILSVHYLFQYTKNTLTPKKTKNVMDFQLQKYRLMLEDLTAVNKAQTFEFSGGFVSPEENRISDTDDVPYYEPSTYGDDTQSEMGSTVDFSIMERELMEMI